MGKKRKTRGSALGSLFEGNVNPYGKSEGAVQDSAESTLLTLSLLAIRPDPNQPRRLLSSHLYHELESGESDPMTVLGKWYEETALPSAPPPQRQAAQELEQLAQTILSQGLINPVTVRPVNNEPVPMSVSYLIRTGERRWWAHVLLTLRKQKIRGKTSPEQIAAIVEMSDIANLRAQQLVENMARSDLALLEKARGIETLQRELSTLRGKNVKWDEIDKMLGISRNYRWRLRKVLQLSDDAIELIAEHDVQERILRPIVDKLLDRPDLQLKAIRQLLKWQENGEESNPRRMLALVESMLQTPKKGGGSKQSNISLSMLSEKLERNVEKTLQTLESLSPDALAGLSVVLANNDDTAEKLLHLRNRLDEILSKGNRSG